VTRPGGIGVRHPRGGHVDACAVLRPQAPRAGGVAPRAAQGTAPQAQEGHLAAKNEQANLRLAAVDAGVTAIEADPDLQSAVDELLDLSEDGQLANMARLGAGERAAELVSRILSRTRRPAVRQRAVSVLRSLRQQN
jgi:hypothetical protein